MDGSGEAFEPVLPGLQDTYWNNVEKCSELVSGDSNYKTLNLFYRTVKLWYSVAEKIQEEKVALVGPLYATILKRVESNYSVPRSRANNVVCVLYKQMKDLEIPCDEISVVESEIKSILLQDNADASLPLVQLISSKEFYSDVFIIRLKEFIVQNPIRGRFAVEKLSNLLKLCEAKPKHQKAVRKLYGSFVECLAYTLKKRNDLETSMKLLHVVPNDMINDDRLVQPLQDFMRDFGKDVSDLSLAGQFFLSIIGREDITLAKILQQYAISSELDSFNPFIDVETNRIDVIHVLYSALTRKKHYVNELFRSSISDFPGLPTDFKLVYGLEKLYGIHKISVDDTVQLLKKLKEYIDQLPPQQTHSDIVQSLIQNIRWIFKMSSWAASVLSSNVDVMCRREVSETLRTNVFRNLLNGDSPLSTLKRYNMFDQEIELDELVESELINLLEEHHDYVDVMILKGLLGIRLSIEWLILPDMVNDDNDTLEETDESELIEEQKRIRTLIQSISDLKFRTEVLENMFSLLFLTKQDISDGNETLIEDGAYDDSDQKEPSAAKKRTPTLSSNTASLNVVITSNSNFLCVNECVPKYLALMKDLTFQAQTELRRSRSGSDCDVDQKQRVTVPSSVKDLDEAKIRLTVLLQYISEAQWRYSVIEPAFVGSNQPKINLNASRAYNFDPYDNMWQIDSETGSSTAAEDNDDRKSKAPVFSSVVPCMLATPDQLLRYCLIENHIDRAKQVFKLFERKLTDTPEAKELFIAEKKRELNSRLKQVCSPPKKHVSRIAETAARGMKVSQVHSVYHEFLMEIGTLTNRKSDANVLLLDFGLTTASNVELSQAALECSLWNPDIDPHRHVSEKIQVFLSKLSSLILVTRDTNASKSASLPSLIAYNALPTLFTKPETLTAESVKSNKLKVCIEDLKQIISQEFTEDHDLSLSLSTVASVLGRPDREKASGKKLVVLYQKLLRLCPPGKYNYLKALFYHVRRVSRVLTECNERRSSHSRDDLSPSVGSYFSVLYQSPSAILCHMVLKDGISPHRVDDLAQEMRVDLIGTLCSLLCPAIPVVTKPEDFGADFYLVDTNFPALCDLIECYLTGSMRKNESIMVMNHFGEDESAYEIRALMKPELIAYFRSKSVLLVDILRLLKLYEPRRESLSNGDNQPAFSENCVLLKWIKLVQTLFTNGTKDESALVALALSPKISVSNWIVMRSLEDHATKKHLLHLYELFRFLQIKTPSSSLHALRIAVLSKLALEYEEVKYVLQIEDARTKTDLLIELIDESPAMSDSELVVRAIQATIASIEKYTVSDDMSAHLKERLQNKVRLVNCYSKIAELSGLNIWKDAYEILSDADILTILKTKRQYNLALQWNSIKKNSKATDREVERLRLELLILAHSDKDNRSELEKLLKNTDDLEYLIEKTLPQIENWDAKEILLSFANQSDSYGNKLYADHLDGIRLIKLLPKNSRSSYAQLMSQPMLIIEQLLMNTEYDVLVEAIAALKSVNCDELIETYARKAVTIELYEEPNSSLVGSDTTFISSSFALEAAAFTMPPSVPTKDQWIADNKVTHCMLCKVEKFSTLFNRRHHCRRCGRVVCASCSQKLMLISEVNAFARVRVCDDCYIQTRAYNDRKESINSCSSSLKLSQWALTLDETQNAITREEFCYEAAPSSSLCLSILRLHSQRTRCVSLFLDQMIKKLFDVLISPQVDYGLVISIIKTLLMSAKVICEEFNELRSQIHHIDLMLSRIDIVKMLVDQNCINKDLINCIIFNESQQSMVKLQEKLLEMERFELALNIGMKHGLDVKGIWKAWAMVCLKNGRFMEARQKFRYVMVETSTNQQVVSLNSKHIHDIVETLKKQKRIPSVRTHLRDRVKAIKNSQSSLLTSRELSSQVAVEGSDIPLVVYDEALYYLTKYGSKEDSIKFFSKFNLSKQAVEVFLSENSAVSLINSFVTDFFLVALRRGNLDSVFTLIRSLDPTLSKSWKYLIATCKHLSKHRQYSVLHTVQLFMGDYLRAAMTQINYFYLRKPLNNYTELHNRADHLKRAIVHCKQNLEVKGHSHPGCFSLPQEHVQRQIRTMNLQLEIASVFCEKKVKGVITFPDELDTSMDSSMDSLQISDGVHSPPSLKSPLTLLDNSKGRKTQLAALVAVFAGDSVNESFRYTQQIIKDHRLDAPFVYRLTGRTILAVKPSRAIELLSQLLHCVQGASPDSEASTVCDDILGACLRSCTNQELSEPLIKMMNSDVNKIDAYILSGKLKSAYLLAVRLERTVDVKRIMLLAERSEQEGVRKICHMWLQRKKGDSQ